jgi:hypothetical protein
MTAQVDEQAEHGRRLEIQLFRVLVAYATVAGEGEQRCTA